MNRRCFLTSMLATAGTAFAAEESHWLAIAEVAGLVRKRKVSPVELTRAALDRIQKLNPALNAFITVTAEDALANSRELEADQRRGRFRGALHGVPIGLKDLYDTAGVRTTAASAQYADRVPDHDAEVVRRLKQAGAILVGKLNMDEFAYNFTSETSCYGPVHNPWKRGYTPGGSSGGSAAAVAAGLCYGALGSDTGGSIRLPAALCGIVGFKPTYGRLPTSGVVPLAWSLDHVGPMTRTVDDARLVLAGMGMSLASPSRPVKSLRLGLPRTPYFEKLEPEVEKAVEAAAGVLSRLTSSVRDVLLPVLPPSPGFEVLPQTYGIVITAEAYTFHEEMLNTHPERYHAGTRQSIQGGAKVAASAYIRARNEMDRLRAESRKLFQETDLLVMPTAPGPAFALGSPHDLIYLRNTAPWNLYGLPAISVPCGFTSQGLPVGLQIVGPTGQDNVVLAAAEAYEQATEWRRRRPPTG